MIYFDNAATTKPLSLLYPLHEKLCEESFANPSSIHDFGVRSSRLLDEARSMVLSAIKLEQTHNVLFCSGASEANNLAIKGIAKKYQNRGKTVITTAVEHPSVLNAVRQLGEIYGFNVIILPVNDDGCVEPSSLEEAMTKDVILVSCMAVNNETGSINDIASLSSIAHKFHKAFFHVDATQAIGKEDIDYSGVDLISFSGHKFGGFKGSGALIYKKTISFLPLISGGEQEYGYRAGTDDMPGYYCLAKAFQEAIKNQKAHYEVVKGLNEALRSKLEEIDEISINSPRNASKFILNFSFKHKKGSVVSEALSRREIYVSSVSACSSKNEKSSYVLEAMNKSEGDAANSLRVSFNETNTIDEVDQFVETLKEIIKEVNDR
ncbi:MAG: cysteine desulfurase [Bacilli bacterium]|nr:cysteine desulfurase [Bacilli bacterium]